MESEAFESTISPERIKEITNLADTDCKKLYQVVLSKLNLKKMPAGIFEKIQMENGQVVFLPSIYNVNVDFHQTAFGIISESTRSMNQPEAAMYINQFNYFVNLGWPRNIH